MAKGKAEKAAINSRENADNTFFMAVLDSVPRQLVQYALFSGGDLYKTIVWFSATSRTVRSTCMADFSWNLAFFLNRNRKHREMHKTMPSLSLLADAVGRFLDKLQWRSYFSRAEAYARAHGSGTSVKRQYVRIKHKPHAPFEVSRLSSLPELEAWTSRFRSHLITEGKRLWSSHYGGGRTWCNTGLSSKLAMEELQDLHIIPVPTDKGGGFSLVPPADLLIMHEDFLFKNLV